MTKPTLEIKNYNNDFLILKSDDQAYLAKIGKSIFLEKLDFVAEVIVTEVEVCLKLKANFDESKIALLQNLELEKKATTTIYNLPVFFNDQEDWETVKLVTGFSKKEIIIKLEATDFSIAMFGFLPGFIYLDGLDASLHVPRKTVPSKYVKANSIAIGGKYVGLYSIDSPGGWQVIGQTPISILEIPQLPPVEMNLGDRIKFKAIDATEFEKIMQKQITLKEYNG